VPPHQLILAGFVIGLIGSVTGAILSTPSPLTKEVAES